MATFTYRLRRIHRWLGLLIGIQFLLWTIGGLYFSWTKLEDIHGDPTRHHHGYFESADALANPQTAVDSLKVRTNLLALTGIELIHILDVPVWRIGYLVLGGQERFALADARSARLRGPVDSLEALAMARRDFLPAAPVASVERITEAGPHSEYRGGALPAWRIAFDHPTGTRVYVSEELGQATHHRNSQWRLFDFLWMLHTMDYEGRDNFNNVLLRAFSIFGLLTILSGFVLFYLTRKRKKSVVAALGLFLLMGLSPALQAQPATLAELQQQAYAANPDLQAAFHQWRAQTERIVQVGALPDPDLMWNWFANPMVRDDPFSQSMFGVMQMLPWGGMRGQMRKGAEADALAAWYRAEDLRLRIGRDVADGWFAIAGMREELRLLREHLDWVRQLDQLLRARLAAGTARQADLVRLELEREELRTRVAVVERDIAGMSAMLKRTLGVPYDHPIAWPDRVPEAARPDTAAGTAHPMVAAMGAMEAGMDAMRRVAGYETRPMVGVGLDAMGPAYVGMLPGDGWALVPKLSLRIPLWGGRARAATREAGARLAAAQAETASAAQELAAMRAAATQRVAAADERLALYRDRLLPRAERLTDLMLADYRAGMADLEEVVMARRMALDYAMGLASARADRNRALTELSYLHPSDIRHAVP